MRTVRLLVLGLELPGFEFRVSGFKLLGFEFEVCGLGLVLFSIGGLAPKRQAPGLRTTIMDPD